MSKRVWTGAPVPETISKVLLDQVVFGDCNGESATGLTALSILSSGAAFNLNIRTSAVYTANRTLTVNVPTTGNGAINLAGAFATTVGDVTLAADAGLTSSVTLPATGTLATLAGIENLTNKTITTATLAGIFAGSVTFSGATLTLTGSVLNMTAGAVYTLGTTDAQFLDIKTNNVAKFRFSTALGDLIVNQTTGNYTLRFSDPAAGRVITFSDPGGADSVVYVAATQTLTAKTLTAPTINAMTFTGNVTGAMTLVSSPLNFTAGAGFVLGTTDNQTITVKTNAVNKFGFTVALGDFTVYQTTGNYTLRFSDPAAGRVVTFPDPLGNDSVAYMAATQILTNKTLTTASIGTLTVTASPINFTAGAGMVMGTTDNQTLTVKTNAVNKFGFTVALGDFTVYQTTGNYTLRFSDPAAGRVITFPDALGNDSVAYLAATQALTNKTVGMAGNLTFATALDIVIPAATAASLEIFDGATRFLTIDTRVATDAVVGKTWNTPAIGFVSAAGSSYRASSYSAYTVTLAGGVGVTAFNGMQANYAAPTLAAGVATVVGIASSIYITPVVQGANMTITNNYMINTSVAGCFLTAAGVWTDACSRTNKTAIKEVELSRIPEMIDSLKVVSYRRKDLSDGGFERFGLIAEEAPDFMASANHQGVSAQYMAGFSLAAIKHLKAENEELKQRIARLEMTVAS
jgi:hypothetical protein